VNNQPPAVTSVDFDNRASLRNRQNAAAAVGAPPDSGSITDDTDRFGGCRRNATTEDQNNEDSSNLKKVTSHAAVLRFYPLLEKPYPL
jgi:hypothetical protein